MIRVRHLLQLHHAEPAWPDRVNRPCTGCADGVQGALRMRLVTSGCVCHVACPATTRVLAGFHSRLAFLSSPELIGCRRSGQAMAAAVAVWRQVQKR